MKAPANMRQIPKRTMGWLRALPAILAAILVAAILVVTAFAKESPASEPGQANSEQSAAGAQLRVLPAQATIRAASAGDNSKLFLPWEIGSDWKLQAGPHNFHPGRTTRLSSLDFSGGDGIARAARGGVVRRPCANFVMIDHKGNWHTSYYHLVDIQVSAGQTVKRGAVLGRISQATGCGGSGGGIDHLHFTLWRFSGAFNMKDNDQQYPLAGVSIGGWTVHKGSHPYAGCMTRVIDGRRICRYDKIPTNLEPLVVGTRDGKGKDKSVFAPGDTIQYTQVVLNPTSKPTKGIFEFHVGNASGSIFDGSSRERRVAPGLQGFYTANTQVPADAPAGKYYVHAAVSSPHYPQGWFKAGKVANFTVRP
jgi:murein DD-endopeptidase MepM/ murein hydrolase activator NlpD